MSRPGDWVCKSCQHMNFTWRDSCQRCGDDVTDRGDFCAAVAMGIIPRGAGVLPGDWYCTARNCGAHNYASKLNCFRCGAVREDSYAYEGEKPRSRGRTGWKSGDWMCTRSGCSEHNFASRSECFKCNYPRDYSS